MNALKTTPLTAWHAQHGGRMVDFAGYSMPVQYEGVMAEHRAVREHCGLFDVSHMAELWVTGPRAREALDGLITNDLRKLPPSGALYTALCNEQGGVLDDVLVYCVTDESFLMVANAANHHKVHAWCSERLQGEARLDDRTEGTALFALQGPSSLAVLRDWPRLASCLAVIENVDYYHHATLPMDGFELLLSRTGYTGEWGYELYAPADRGLSLWTELVESGQRHGLRPVGLGARDTLRLEAGYSLYGHELDEGTTPYEAGIGWVVKLNAGPFLGREALRAQKESGIPRRTIALKLTDRGIARQGAEVVAREAGVGVVTSGTFSPTLGASIALARVASEAVDDELSVDVRGRRIAAQRVAIPFVPSRVRG